MMWKLSVHHHCEMKLEVKAEVANSPTLRSALTESEQAVGLVRGQAKLAPWASWGITEPQSSSSTQWMLRVVVGVATSRSASAGRNSTRLLTIGAFNLATCFV